LQLLDRLHLGGLGRQRNAQLSLSTRPPEEENELARSLVRQRATGIFFHPSQRQINTS
jgi:hypothetical protein